MDLLIYLFRSSMETLEVPGELTIKVLLNELPRIERG